MLGCGDGGNGCDTPLRRSAVHPFSPTTTSLHVTGKELEEGAEIDSRVSELVINYRRVKEPFSRILFVLTNSPSQIA
jgi:hypothetical protein